ncbi:serine/threonine-protein kinase D1-like isoform X2 [Rhopilema esculentum]|uniref:serine/threonine-protein kinase D1-like isoform X2 n=1 Tax=Rhopilema esculentum TaxID=499914 RepID=UPI0031CFA40F
MRFSGCGGNFHKRCAMKIPNNCNESRLRSDTNKSTLSIPRKYSDAASIGSNASGDTYFTALTEMPSQTSSPSPSLGARRMTWTCGRPVAIDKLVNKLEIPHTFVIHSYRRPTVCNVCRKLLKGLFRQGYQCKDCKFNCHKRCFERAPRNCLGEIASISRTDSAPDDAVSDSQSDIDFNELHEDIDQQEDDEVITEGNDAQKNKDEGQALAETMSNNIPLQRIVVSVKHQKRRSSKVLKQGWMLHYTERDTSRRKHYWRLDTKHLTMFQADTGRNYYKDIPLQDVLAIETNTDHSGKPEKGGAYVFALKTTTCIYYCGEREEFDEKGSIIPAEPDSGKGIRIGLSWAEIVKNALQPIAMRTEAAAAAASVVAGSAARSSAQGKDKIKTMEESDKETEQQDQAQDFSEVYQLFTDEILGSGQFGVVYGGVHRKTGRDVAVKVIDKLRFPTKEERALKNEVTILQTIHQGAVVNLEWMFETPERIFVVMEKMKGDMLEMILNSSKGRLSEKETKFLIHQILVALKYLHSQNIVHCDLKPENVLIAENVSKSKFPQIKLCDFGFARIIGRESFRRSVVGTPAYLAPEVLNNKKYNRSLDMWSVGVIIYVSLSGTFPFNEEEEIADQIKNAAFMYPPNPWAEVSAEAIDLINKLLQVKITKRLSCQQALFHVWMQDYNTWLELRSLEEAVGRRYLTHESDDERWQRYEKSLRATPTATDGEISFL